MRKKDIFPSSVYEMFSLLQMFLVDIYPKKINTLKIIN